MEISFLEHQQQVLEQTKDKNRVAYYLDMGLGKTFVGAEKLINLDADTNLVVCQKSKIEDWVEHFKKYYKVAVYDLTNKKQFEMFNFMRKGIGVINYDLVWRRKELSELSDFTLMLDESSCIKNTTSKRTKFILKLNPSNVILLSGTPVGGKYEELYSQCKLLDWKITKKAFWNSYVDFVTIDIGGFPMKKVLGYKNIDRLKDKLHQHGAVFMKTEEVINLPNQNFINVICGNTTDYNKFKKQRYLVIDDKELIGDTSLTRLLYLRQLASQYSKNKLAKLEDLLESTNNRVVVFYNFKEECEKIVKLCERIDKPVSFINGDIKDLDNYNEYDNTVVLCQYQAAAMGHNLQKSNIIIYYSLPLSSELFEQSKKRIHRIGQDKTCFYYILLTNKSIEFDILETLNSRKDFTDKLFEKMEGELI